MVQQASLIRHRQVDEIACNSLPAELPPLLRRIYAARGVGSAAQLDISLPGLLPPAGLKDIDMAALRLADAVRKGERLLVVGDYDADGGTSVAVVLLALRAMYRREERDRIHYLVPNRFNFGYGLTPELVEVAAEQRPALLITVDNGITSCDGVAHANRLGMQVIITDHHLPGATRPAALAIVNPNQRGCDFAAKSTAGVGVAFYLMTALRSRLRQQNWFAAADTPAEPRLAELLDLVALGTVADLVPLERNNRILVQEGLKRMRAGKTRPGLLALVRESGRERSRLSTSDMGFYLAPRLNAAGRLKDMSLGIDCLLTDDQSEANRLAAELDSLNRDRRALEREICGEAEAILKSRHKTGSLPPILVLHDDNWHQGLLGIVAGRLKQRFDRPAITLAPTASDADFFQGSARSVPGLNIRDLLEAAHARNPGLLEKFGGHAMAAGLTVHRAQLDSLQPALEQEVAPYQKMMEEQRGWLTDGPLAEDELTLATLQALEAAGPFGQGFPEPQFDNHFELLQEEVVGQGHLRLRLRLPGSEQVLRGIWFNRDKPTHAQALRLVYQLQRDDYLGDESISLLVRYAEPARKGPD